MASFWESIHNYQLKSSKTPKFKDLPAKFCIKSLKTADFEDLNNKKSVLPNSDAKLVIKCVETIK